MNNDCQKNSEASWLWRKNPWFWESVKKRRRGVLELLDGAYFGLNGQDVVCVDFQWGLHNLSAEWHKIVGHNLGVKKESRFTSSDVQGSTLFALIDWKWWTSMNHLEAQNEKLVHEVNYPEAVRYIGQRGTADFITEILRNPSRREQAGRLFGILPDELLEVFEQPLYQVRWVGHGRMVVSDFDIDRPDPGPVWIQYRF